MKKMFRKTIATVLSALLALSVFGCIPAFAATYGLKGENVTFEDESSDTAVTFASKVQKLNIDSTFAGTEVRLSNITQSYITENYPADQNRIKTIKYYSNDPTVRTVNSTDFANITDGNILFGDTDGTYKNASGFGLSAFFNGTTNIKYSDQTVVGTDRVTAGGYDIRLLIDLGATTKIDSFYMFNHIRLSNAIVTYKVFAGDNKSTLYNAENEVAFFDYYNASRAETYKFNNNGNGNIGCCAEGQIWDFKGTQKPVGRYVGIVVYDASLNDNFFQITDISVTGTSNLEFADFAVTNDVPAASTKALSEKLENLQATSQYADTSLRMTALSKDYFDTTYGSRTNLINSINVGYYANKDSSTPYETVTSKLANVTDGQFVYGTGSAYNNATTDQFIGADGSIAAKLYSGTDKGDALVKNDEYDATLVLDLSAKTVIDTFYMFNHIQPYTALSTYKVFVSDNSSNLFDASNEVSYWNYYDGYSKSDAGYLYNSYNVNDKNPLHRSEGQVWSFGGATKPAGRFVGVKVYDAAAVSGGFLTIYDIGVFGSNNSVVLSDKTITNDLDHTAALGEKLPYLTATSQIADTSLRMTAMSQAYLDATYGSRTNLIGNIQCKYWKDAGYSALTPAINSAVTDKKILSADGTNYINGDNPIYAYNSTVMYDGEDSLDTRVQNDEYDASLILDLGDTNTIDTFYMFNHIRATTSVACYKVFVSDSADDLFNAENETVFWDYANAYSKADPNKYMFNTPYDADKANTLTRSEGQEWSFNGAEKPSGRYVGVRIYDAAISSGYLCIYDIGVFGTSSHTVNFADKSGNVFYTTNVVDGGVLSPTQVSDAVAKVPEIFGYNKKIESEAQAWDKDITEAINAGVTFKAEYERDTETLYKVTTNYITGTPDVGMYSFDTKLGFTEEGAASWKVNGNFFAAGPAATMFVFGEMVVDASTEAPGATPSVMISGKHVSNEFITFAKIYNPTNKTVASCGIIFTPASCYNAMSGVTDWTDQAFAAAGMTENVNYVKAEVKSTTATDYMGILRNYKVGKQRYAKAYVVFTDNTAVYSDVVTSLD